MVDAVGLFDDKGINYKLPDEFNSEALKAKDNMKMEKSKSSRSFVYMTALIAALTMATPAFSQNKDKPNEVPAYSVEMVKNYPSLKYIVDNFDKYFKDPEMKKHLEAMIAKMGSNKEGVEQALKLTIMNLKDPKQRIGGSIYAIEDFVIYTKGFGTKYDKEITDETFLVMEEFNKIFDQWIDSEIERLNKKLVEQGKESVKLNQEIEEILKSFSSQQVKSNTKLQGTLIKFKATLKTEEIKKLSVHTQGLLNLVP